MRAFVMATALAACAAAAGTKGDYDYSEGGDNWTGTCIDTTSEKQSPINIDTGNVVKDYGLAISISGYESSSHAAWSTGNPAVNMHIDMPPMQTDTVDDDATKAEQDRMEKANADWIALNSDLSED